MSDVFRVRMPGDSAEDDAAREERHQLLATLLGAYADGELPAETASQIDAHLLGCGRCRSELRVQQAVRDRLSRSTVPTATVALQDRIRVGIAAVPTTTAPRLHEPTTPHAGVSPRTRVAVWIAVATAVTVSLFVLGRSLVESSRAPFLDPPPLEAHARVAVLQTVLTEYRRVTQGDLPGRARDLDAVRSALPFAVAPIDVPDAHLLAAWTTDLDGEPAAALAYRWGEQVVIQFVIGESTLYRSPEMRTAFAARQAVVRQDGKQGMIAWPDAAAGSIVVGNVPWSTLIPLTRARTRTR